MPLYPPAASGGGGGGGAGNAVLCSGGVWPARPALPVVEWFGLPSDGTPSDMGPQDVLFHLRDTVAPATPTGLAATAGQDRQVTLNWTANTDVDLAYYLVKVGPHSGTLVVQPDHYPTNTAIMLGLTNGTNYDFAVAAVDTSGNIGTYSAIQSATPADTVAPNAPTAYSTPTIPNDSEIVLQWVKSNSIDWSFDEYRLRGLGAVYRGAWASGTAYVVGDSVRVTGSVIAYRCTTNVTGGAGPAADTTHWSVIAWGAWTVASSPLTIGGLTNGDTYDFQMRSTDDDGNVCTTPLNDALDVAGYTGIVPVVAADAIQTWLDEMVANGGVVGYWYAKKLATVDGLVDGNSVTTWSDGSGGGHTLTSHTGLTKPIYHAATSAFNNKPTCTFAGVSALESAPWADDAQANGLFVIASAAGTATITDGLSATAKRLDLGRSASNFVLRANSSSTITGEAVDGSAHAWCGVFNGSSSHLIQNGGHDATGSPGADASAGLTIGATGSSLVSKLTGEVALVLVLNRAPATQEQSDFFAAASAWYGI